jgi:hypothetical protein
VPAVVIVEAEAQVLRTSDELLYVNLEDFLHLQIIHM